MCCSRRGCSQRIDSFDLNFTPSEEILRPQRRRLGRGHGGQLQMEITDVRVFPVEEDKLKAYVTITLDNCFVIRDLKVINGTSGLFIAMPAKRRKDGSYTDIAHPLNADTRGRMEKTILIAYEQELKRMRHDPPPAHLM